MIAIDISKQQAPDADPKGIQQINFTGSLEQQATCFSLLNKQKKTIQIFHKEL